MMEQQDILQFQNGSNNERVQIIYNSIANNIAMSIVSSNSGQASITAIRFSNSI